MLLLGRACLVVACVAAAACFSVPAEFTCADDRQCQLPGDDGRCEPTHYCSVPRADCPTGRRYVDSAGSLSGRCVEPVDASAPVDAGADG